MTDEDLRRCLRTHLQALGVPAPADAELPVALLRAVLERLNALDAVELDGQEPLALPWTEEAPWTSSS